MGRFFKLKPLQKICFYVKITLLRSGCPPHSDGAFFLFPFHDLTTKSFDAHYGVPAMGRGTSVVGGGIGVRVLVGLGVLVLTVGVGGGGELVPVGTDVFVMVCVGKKVCVLVGKKNPSPRRRVLVSEIEVREGVILGVRDAVDVIANVGLGVAVSDGRTVSAGNSPENASTVRACSAATHRS
jgi:hypothetical protein